MQDTKLHLGIEVGDVLLKVALFDPMEKKVLKTAVLDTGTSPLDDVPTFENTLQGWLAGKDGVDLESVSVCVSSFRSLVREVFVPPEAAATMDNYLRWYLGLNVDAEENAYYFDSQILSGDAKAGYNVLLIAMRRAWVDAVRKGFRNKAIAPKIMEVDALSLLNLMEMGYGFISDMRCIIKADVAGVLLMWIANKDIRAIRCCSTLEIVGKARETAYAQLAKSINEQIMLASETNGVAASEYLLCGELASDVLFVESLRSCLSEQPLKLMDSFTNIRLPVAEEDASHVLSCAGAIGVALRGGKE